MPTKVKEKEKVIEDITFSSSNQAISRRIMYNYKENKIKLEIKSDSYQIQCYARASILQGVEWKVLYSIPYSLMKTPNKLKYYSEARNENTLANTMKKYFDEDIKTLKKYVEELL